MRHFSLIRRKPEALEGGDDLTGALDAFLRFPFKINWMEFDKFPKMDVYEKEKKLFVRVELPGVDQKDIRLMVSGNISAFKAEKRRETEIRKDEYHQMESSLGSFERVLELPSEVKIDQIKAVYSDGVLKIELSKKESYKPKEIPIDFN